MTDIVQAKDYIETLGVIFSMIIATISLVRSSKQRQNDDIDKRFDQQKDRFDQQDKNIEELGDLLQDHAREDLEVQTELKTDLKNAVKMMEKLDTKTDRIMEKL